MPGVMVGDIGPKFGFNGVDNGFLKLEYVRVREWPLPSHAVVGGLYCVVFFGPGGRGCSC